MVSRLSIFALDFAAEVSNAEIIHALNSVTRVLAAVVEKPSLMKSIVIADGLCFSLHYLVVPSHHLAGLTARGRRAVVTQKCSITATRTMSPVQSALS